MTRKSNSERMSAKDVITQLEAMGTAQNGKIYARHGAGENQFGVSFANLGKLRKRIKTDHEPARFLCTITNKQKDVENPWNQRTRTAPQQTV